jgi:hypothetical protein
VSASSLSYELTLLFKGEGFTEVEVWSNDGGGGSAPEIFGPGYLPGEANVWGLRGVFSYLSPGDEIQFTFDYDDAGEDIVSCLFAGLSCMPDISPPRPGSDGRFAVDTFMGAPPGWMGGDFIIRGDIDPGEEIEVIVLYNDSGSLSNDDVFVTSRDYKAFFEVKPAVIPLPSSLPLLASGLLLFGVGLRRRNST